MPARVAELHRSIFEHSAKPIPGGKVHCLLTVHDDQASDGSFYAAVLFGGGSVATWTQSAKGKVDPFIAKLTGDEYARALALLDEAALERSAAANRFSPSTMVMGVSTPSGDRVETAYFASDQTPEPLDRLAQLLKHRLEATNAR